MNKRVLALSLILIAIVLVFRFCNSNKPDQKAEVKPAPVAMSENSGSFNQSFTELLDAYYALKDAFAADDTVKVNATAARLVNDADSLKVNEIQGDTSGTIKETAISFASAISSSARAIGGESDIEAKRRELNMITDAMWNLTRTVHYSGQKVYYQFCAAAFDNSGAYWMSDKVEDLNPYFGKKKPDCREVTDSLDYRKK